MERNRTERNGVEWNAMLHSAPWGGGRLRIAKAAAAKAQEQDDKRVEHLSKKYERPTEIYDAHWAGICRSAKIKVKSREKN